MSRQQRTIRKSVELAGRGLFDGRETRVRVNRAEPDRGIVFVRADLEGRPELPASAAHIAARSRWTGLCKGDAKVRMVEHLLSAAYGLGIDNLLVETWGEEIPIGDGSAKTYVDLMLEAGVEEQDVPGREVVLREAVKVEEEAATLEAVPNPGGFRVSYTLDYEGRFIGTQSLTIDIDESVYIREIAPARTYVLRPEIEPLLQQGLGKGASLENLLIVDEDGAIEGDVRFRDECVRHKIVDILGDLCLVGCRIHAHVLGYRSGHFTNQELAKRIVRQIPGS